MVGLRVILFLLICSPAWGAITVGDCTHASVADGNGGDVTVTAPTGIDDNEILLAFYGYGETTDISAVAITGFTQIAYEEDTGGSNTTIWMAYKVASSESGNYDFAATGVGGQGAVGILCVVSGVDTSNVLDVTYATGSHYSKDLDTTTPQAQAITTVTDGAEVFVFQYERFSGSITDIGVPATPGTWTEREESLDGTDRMAAVASYNDPDNGTVTPAAQTITGGGGADDWANFVVALRPASSGALLLRRRR